VIYHQISDIFLAKKNICTIIVNMKLSAKSRYAIRALIDLDMNKGENPVSIRDIAERQKISESYLENIFSDLRNAGILGSIKGKNGGFYMIKRPEEVSLLDVLEILEGELKIVDCVDTPKCESECECYTHDFWRKLNTIMKDSLRDIKLSDIKKLEV
jgi:Rrf2 family transcriptional regulator, cysteine metabolism repressor